MIMQTVVSDSIIQNIVPPPKYGHGALNIYSSPVPGVHEDGLLPVHNQQISCDICRVSLRKIAGRFKQVTTSEDCLHLSCNKIVLGSSTKYRMIFCVIIVTW